MPAANYTFRLNNLHINSKRNNKDYVDKDFVVFAVTVGASLYAAPACRPPNESGYIGLTKDGDTIPLYDKGSDTDWEIGPVFIQDEDIVSIVYTVTNLSYNDDPTNLANGLKLAGDTLTFIAGIIGIGIVAGPTPPGIAAAIIAGVIGAVGIILQGLGDIIGAIFGTQQDCDGPVLVSPQIAFTGAGLFDAVNTPIPPPIPGQLWTQYTTTITNQNLTQASPGGCWTPNTDVTWSILKDTPNLNVFGGPGPGKLTAPLPLAVSASPQDWEGTWGDAQYTENCRILCEIGSAGNGVSGKSASERISSFLGGLQHLIQNAPLPATSLMSSDIRRPRASNLALASVPQAPRAISFGLPRSMPVTARYSVYSAEHLGSPSGRVAAQINTAHLVEIPILVEPEYGGDIYPSALPPGEVVAVPKEAAQALGKVAIPISANVQAVAGKVTIISAPNLALPMSYAASLVATTEVSLHLYAIKDDSGKIVDHRVRYIRVSNGEIVTDVMLSPSTLLPQ